MELSWKSVQEVHNLHNIHFNEYFKNIGIPFINILKKLGIKKDLKKIKKTYQSKSIEEINKIKFFKNTITTLKYLKKNYILNILTSKDSIRTKKFLNTHLNLFTIIECDNERTKGKPHPNKINKIIKKLKCNKSDCIYVGDTHIDYKTSKNSRIDFIYAQWGYGKNFNYKYKCKDIKDLRNLLIN